MTAGGGESCRRSSASSRPRGRAPAQLGLLEAARARGLYVIAADRDPAAPGFAFADRRAIISVEDEPQLDRLATAERVNGVVAPGIDWPVAIAARIAERLALPHPIDAATAVLATSKLQPARALRRGGRATPAPCRLRDPRGGAYRGGGARLPVRRQGARPPGAEGARARAATSRCSRTASSSRSASRASSVVLVEELVPGREVTVNAFSIDGALHAADRHRPRRRRAACVRGRARARLAELAARLRARRGRRGSPRGRGGARRSERAELHAGRRRRARRVRRRARGASRRRSRRRALRSGDRRRPERPRARRSARRAGGRRRSRSEPRAAPASASSSRSPES